MQLTVVVLVDRCLLLTALQQLLTLRLQLLELQLQLESLVTTGSVYVGVCDACLRSRLWAQHLCLEHLWHVILTVSVHNMSVREYHCCGEYSNRVYVVMRCISRL